MCREVQEDNERSLGACQEESRDENCAPRLITGEISPLQCAGLNRLEAEEEEASRERTSDPLGPEFCVGYREVHDEA